ncbi:kinase-like protein [Lepidopterella palustris CBS 459.81]|uniref:Kinase-like protein n=1 Tax=Lepidopterella palustris CBS 459.81 TaxID=1314670 RepID=A0A8E2DZT7_9PEZI|nr:kinase-like protein [Lepidopterella palustris CBS 459.81]
MSRRSLSNHNSKGSEADKELKELLKKARVESPSDCHEFFVPNCSQEQLITIEIVSRIIVAAHPSIPPEELRILAQKTCQSSRHLFAILAYLKKGADIYHLHAEDITDEDLPFERRHDAQISRKTGKLIRTFENWSDDDLERFHRCQWWMTAPIFEDGRHYELADNTVLPFTPLRDAEAQTPKTGGYSEVSSAHIHPSHHRFSGLRCSLLEKGGMLVAIKKLNSPDEKVFRKEQDILEKLGSKQPQLHLIKLLATYKHKHKYHLVFPRADANLRQYWDTNPKPVFDRTTVLWSLKQMAGIAQALRVVHNFRVSIPLNIEGAGGVRVQKGVQLSVKKGEELYGRHGDIKPENVLWFKYLDGIEDQNGVLQLADFGLGRFHGRDSRSKIPPSSVLGSPTYEPPECRLHMPVSRAYDIWSLACLYLEFVTWLLMGTSKIDVFANSRGQTGSLGINEDNFFTIISPPTGCLQAEVRKSVTEWVGNLHSHPKCTNVIHDLLNLVMNKLLVINSSNRMRSAELSQNLKILVEKAEGNDMYLLNPAPQPRESIRNVIHMETSGNPKPKQHQSAPGISTSTAQRRGAAIKSHTEPPRDLLLRRAGTPALARTPGTNTWPMTERPIGT